MPPVLTRLSCAQPNLTQPAPCTHQPGVVTETMACERYLNTYRSVGNRPSTLEVLGDGYLRIKYSRGMSGPHPPAGQERPHSKLPSFLLTLCAALTHQIFAFSAALTRPVITLFSMM